MMLAVASYDSPEFREQHAADQRQLLLQMCRETGLTLSALATEAGLHNSTITRYTRQGKPNKWDTFVKVVQAYVRIMGDKGKSPSPNIMSYVQNSINFEADVATGKFIEHLAEGGTPKQFMERTSEELEKLAKSREEDGLPSVLTAARLRVALAMANEEFETGLSAEDVDDIAAYVNALYPIIVAAEASTGRPADPHDMVLRARIKRERARRESSGYGDN